MSSRGYYFTAEPVGCCSCHDCTCRGCADCAEPQDANVIPLPPLGAISYDPADPWGTVA